MRRTRRVSRLALLLAALAVLALAGCGQKKREVYADYVLPPNAVADVSAIGVLDIEQPDLTLTGKYPGKEAELKAVFANAIVQRLEGRLYANGFIKATDDIYADEAGLAQVRREILASRHGYDVKPPRIMDTAKLAIRARVAIVRSTGTDTIQTQLVTQPYSIGYDKEGVPYSSPDSGRRRVRTVTSRVPYVLVKAAGELNVELRDRTGKLVYTKAFKGLEFEDKVGGAAGPGAEPTLFQVAQGLFADSLATVVKDISPHREARALVVNEQGDPTAVALMKATAFSEAHARLADILEQGEGQYQAAEATINAEFAPRLQAATTDAEIQALEEEKRKALVEAGRFLSPDFENMAILTEIVGDRGDALMFYELAVEADPDNATAGNSLGRIKELVGASGRMDVKDKAHRFEQQLYKER